MPHKLRERLRVRDWVAPDPWLAAPIAALFALGLVMIQSATITQADGAFVTGYFVRQAVVGGVGIAAAAAVYHRVSLDWWRRHSLALLLACGVLLLLTHVPALGRPTREGVNRWIDLGMATFQPVEAAKLFIIVYLAAYCARRGREMALFSSLVPVGLVCALFGVLLLLQPDLGSTVLLLAIATAIVFVAGARLRYLFLGFGLAAAAIVPVLLTSRYAWKRLTSFARPFDQPYGEGYQQTHSLIAFGRGDWTGLGLGQSIEKWGGLSEAHNDFIISVVAEELGFVGFALVVALYALCVIRCFLGAAEASQRGNLFASCLLVGISTLLMLQVTINMAANLSLGPVKGLTLPFVSFGGSSLLMSLLMAGIALRALRELRRPDEAPERKYCAVEQVQWTR